MDAKVLLNRIILEKERADRQFVKLEFNVRESQVVMRYVYEDEYNDDIHMNRHDADPELMDADTFENLKQLLNEKKIPYQARRDEFM